MTSQPTVPGYTPRDDEDLDPAPDAAACGANVTAFLTRDCLHAGSDVSQRQLRRWIQVGEPSEGVSRRKKSSDSAKINSASLSSVATW